MPGYDFNAPGPAFVRFTNAVDWYDEDAFLRSLARANVAPREPPNASMVVSGAFAALPAELIDAICVELLIGWSWFPGRIRTAQYYASLVIACRWVRASVSRRVMLEAKCINLNQMGHALPVLPLELSYVDYAKMAIRSRFEVDMLYRYFKKVSFHCADPTAECCRGLRAELNDDLSQAPVSMQFPLDSLGAEALAERTGRRVSVVAPERAQLLCATPGGALLCNDERVWSVTSEPAEEFAPGYELATAFSTSRMNKLAGDQIWGAAKGTLIAVCEPLADWNNTMYSLRIFDNGRLVAEAKMSNRDASFRGAGVPHTIWIHDGEVCLLWLHRAADWCHARLMWIHPNEAHCPENEWTTTAYRYANVVSMSVATDAGHVAILHSDGIESGSKVQLYFYNGDTKQGSNILIPSSCPLAGGVDCLLQKPLQHSITLSPDGRQMVLFDRTPGNSTVISYTRGNPHWLSPNQGWRMDGGCLLLGRARVAMEHGYLEKVVFTPCGRRAFAFFMGNPRSKDGVLEIGPAVLLAARCGLDSTPPSDHKHNYHYTTSGGDTPDVPANVAWSNDGLFVATLSGGVLRMGLVARDC
tara:strand:+ start:282 stop:2036 length:1755 start_codon:yes stop_codon:yes gene_type:complete